MASYVTSTHEFCLLDVISIAQLPRGDYKRKVLHECWDIISQSTTTLRLWCEPYKLESITSDLVSIERARVPLYVSRSLPVTAINALKTLTWEKEENQHDADESCKKHTNLLEWWPDYIGNKFMGTTIVQDGEVVVWCADSVRHTTTYAFIEYAPHSTILKDFIVKCKESSVIIRFFEETLLSLRDAWKRGIVHTHPTMDNILYDVATDTSTWCGLSALRGTKELESATGVILTVIANYYELIALNEHSDTVREVRSYLDAKLNAWGINQTLRILIASGAKYSNAFRLWNRDLDFDSVCESMIASCDTRRLNCTNVTPTISFLDKPRATEGFIYHALLLYNASDIDVNDLRSYEATFEGLFTSTKTEVKRLLKEGRASMVIHSSDSVEDISQRVLMATADWLTARLLIDGLATRNEYRNSLISDTIANNANQYVIEMKAKLLRMTGECESYFNKLSYYLDYETMDDLTYRWETLRDVMHKIR